MRLWDPQARDLRSTWGLVCPPERFGGAGAVLGSLRFGGGELAEKP